MAVTPLRIPTISQRQPIVDDEGRATVEFLRTINGALQSIGYALNQVLLLPEIQMALTGLDAATAAALAAADTANGAATTVTAQANLANSYVSGVTLTATDAGTSARIAISAHTRFYGDDTNVAVSAGAVTGLAYDTLYYIVYEDAARLGGAVTYTATMDAAVAAQTGNTHVVGSATTPLAAGAAQDGDPVLPPGSGTIKYRSIEP
ncbi:MAG: hypothetical protein JWR85_3590 [Marmoricola sp.]|nr:hypothetical protein [Marmoricola sp.]